MSGARVVCGAGVSGARVVCGAGVSWARGMGGVVGVDEAGVDAAGVDAAGVDAAGVDAAGVDEAGVFAFQLLQSFHLSKIYIIHSQSYMYIYTVFLLKCLFLIEP